MKDETITPLPGQQDVLEVLGVTVTPAPRPALKPYYQDDHVTLYHGDCLELADLWTGADVLVTDPPYGMGYQSGQRKGEKLSLIHGDDNTAIRDSVVQIWGGCAQPSCLVGGRWTRQQENVSGSFGGKRGTLEWVI